MCFHKEYASHWLFSDTEEALEPSPLQRPLESVEQTLDTCSVEVLRDSSHSKEISIYVLRIYKLLLV